MTLFKTLPLLVLIFLMGCSEPTTFKDESGKNRVARMSAEERTLLAPNELFLAVLDADLNKVDELSTKSPDLLYTRNSQDGNTPLGLSLQIREFQIADALYKKMTLSELMTTNTWGEGYVFIAAREGHISLIQKLSDQYYRSLGLTEDFEFSDLDVPNLKGQRALHVAKNRAVAEALEIEYYRGTLEFPLYKFSLHADDEGKNFLHLAAAQSRTDVLRWAVEKYCSTNSWEQEGDWLWGSLGYLYSRGQRGVQTYLGGFGLGLDAKINWQDIIGKTPLHYAVERRDSESVQVVSSCQWTSFDREDVEGDIPLQTFLKNLNDSKVVISDGDRQIFNLLVHRQTKMKTWFWSQSDYVNHQNQQGQSALHLAAKLADPYFYNTLSPLGDTELSDNAGLKPKDIFRNRRTRIEQNGF